MAKTLALLLLLLFLSSSSSSSAENGSGSCATNNLSSSPLYADCVDLSPLSAALHFSFDSNSSELSLAFAAAPASPSGWVAWGLNPSPNGGMLGTQALIAFKLPNGSMSVDTYNITSYAGVVASEILYEATDLVAKFSGGMIWIYGKLRLPKGVTELGQVWQVGSSVTGGVPDRHAFEKENLASKGALNLVKGTVVSTGGGGGSGLKEKNVHGVLNAVSWGILLPIGAIFSRYLRTFETADPAWFYLHVTCQVIGYGVGVGGWATGLNLGSKSKGVQYNTHRNIGITLFVLGTLQVFALLLRPNKDHKYRFYWNIYHHLAGYTVIALGIANVFKGLQILDSTHKWTTIYIVAICILGGIALVLEAITWCLFLKKKSANTKKQHGGSSSNGFQQPLSV